MYLPETDDEITDLLNGLPDDVFRVLGMPEETSANMSLVDSGMLSDDALVRFSRFYLTIIAKRNPLREIPMFFRDSLGMNDPERLGVMIARFAERLSWYGDYFPDLPEVAKEWGVAIPSGEPLIAEARRMLSVEVESSGSVDTNHVPAREKLALVPALGKYPRLGEQQITQGRIRVKGRPEPARPSLSNWIRVYRDELGVGYHEPMVRGKFLFDSENGRALSSGDRERLNLVLRSIEENIPVDIDTERVEIAFPEEPEPKQERRSFPEPVRHESETRRPTVPKEDARPLRADITEIVRHETPEPSLGSRIFANDTKEHPSVPMAVPFSSKPVAAKPTHPEASAPFVPPKAPPAPKRRPTVFSPAPPENLPVGGNISFSSAHALPVESEERGGMSIRRPSPSVLPSGSVAFRESPNSPGASASVPVGSSKAPSSVSENPFRIHPASLDAPRGGSKTE